VAGSASLGRDGEINPQPNSVGFE
jgi:hypothetical protein